MRIAQIAPLHEAVPPKLYGGTERVVSYLTEALVDLGHDVTLFASGDSQRTNSPERVMLPDPTKPNEPIEPPQQDPDEADQVPQEDEPKPEPDE